MGRRSGRRQGVRPRPAEVSFTNPRSNSIATPASARSARERASSFAVLLLGMDAGGSLTGPLHDSPALVHEFGRVAASSCRASRPGNYRVGDAVHHPRGQRRAGVPRARHQRRYGCFPNRTARLWRRLDRLSLPLFLRRARPSPTSPRPSGADQGLVATAVRELVPGCGQRAPTSARRARLPPLDIDRDFVIFDILIVLTGCSRRGVLNDQLLAAIGEPRRSASSKPSARAGRQVAGMVPWVARRVCRRRPGGTPRRPRDSPRRALGGKPRRPRPPPTRPALLVRPRPRWRYRGLPRGGALPHPLAESFRSRARSENELKRPPAEGRCSPWFSSRALPATSVSVFVRLRRPCLVVVDHALSLTHWLLSPLIFVSFVSSL